MFGTRPKRRTLNELGSVDLPARLEDRGSVENRHLARFAFDRTSNSIFMMGSNRPISEKLVLGVWEAGYRDETWQHVRSEAPERTSDIRWTHQGDYEIGDGIHEVNTSKHPAWIVLREAREKQAIAGYMLWKKNGSLDEAKRVVDGALASLTFERPIPEYLALAADRPAQLAAKRRAEFQQLLSARGLHLQLDGPVVEHDGGYYQLHSDRTFGERFEALVPLGSLPRARRFRQMRPTTPKGVSQWPPVCWFAWEDAAWKSECEYEIAPAMVERLNVRHQDRERVYFYAMCWDLPVDPERGSSFNLTSFWIALDPMKQGFPQGTVIRPE